MCVRYLKNPQNLFIKNCVFILTRLNFSYLKSTLHLMQYTYEDVFSIAQNRFWTRRFWCLLVLLPLFCFTSTTLADCFPLRTFFIGETHTHTHTHTDLLGRDQVNREGGAWRSCLFLVKNCLTLSVVWAGALVNLPSWNGQRHSKSLQSNLTGAEPSLSQELQLVHW